MATKQNLVQEMMQLAQQLNFQEYFQEILKEILQCKPVCPYQYLNRKISVKSKFDNTKSSQFICQLAMYVSTINVLYNSKENIRNKIMGLCIDKYNHSKIRKSEVNQFVSFILIDITEKQKDPMIKLIHQTIQNQTTNVMLFSGILYYTMLYKCCIIQMKQLNSKLKLCGQSLNSSYLKQYLIAVQESQSMIKMIGLSFKEGENIEDKLVGFIANQLGG